MLKSVTTSPGRRSSRPSAGMRYSRKRPPTTDMYLWCFDSASVVTHARMLKQVRCARLPPVGSVPARQGVLGEAIDELDAAHTVEIQHRRGLVGRGRRFNDQPDLGRFVEVADPFARRDGHRDFDEVVAPGRARDAVEGSMDLSQP